jgi:hypothetical protein
MFVRVLDLQSFDETLEIPDDLTVSELRDLIHLMFHYDVSSASFFHNGAELPADGSLSPGSLGELPLVVLFNSRIFPEKSFPKVDQAFRFFPSRYQEFAFTTSFAEDVEPSGRHAGSARRAAARDPDPIPLGLFDADAPNDGLGLRERMESNLARIHASLQGRIAAIRQTQQRILLSPEDLRAMYGLPEEVQLTPADILALRRLDGSGVDRPTIASVYIACERNEALAQSCLMSME